MACAPNVFMTGKIALLDLDRCDGVAGTGVLPVTTASISTKMETPDASSYASSGFTTLVPGIVSAEITMEIAYDKVALPPIFAGMKADVTLAPAGTRETLLTSSPISTEVPLGDEYAASAVTYFFPNCTVSQVSYEVPVKDIQKVKLTLVPSCNAELNWGDITF